MKASQCYVIRTPSVLLTLICKCLHLLQQSFPAYLYLCNGTVFYINFPFKIKGTHKKFRNFYNIFSQCPEGFRWRTSHTEWRSLWLLLNFDFGAAFYVSWTAKLPNNWAECLSYNPWYHNSESYSYNTRIIDKYLAPCSYNLLHYVWYLKKINGQPIKTYQKCR